MNRLPGDPDIHPLLGSLHKFPGFNEAGIAFDWNNAKTYKYFHRFWGGPFMCVLNVYHPETIREVLKHSIKPRNIGAVSTTYDMGLRWLGEGLILTNGQRWYRNRRLLTPSFHFEILKKYIKVYNSCAKIFMSKIVGNIHSRISVDIQPMVSRYTLDVILQCAFSLESNCQCENKPGTYAKAIAELQLLWMERMLNPLHFFEFIYRMSSKGRRFYHLCNVVHAEAEALIKKRRKELGQDSSKSSDKKARDFLDTLITAKDDDGNGLTFGEMRDEVDTFLFAGHDTTASGIMWTLVSLAQNHQHQDRVFKEVNDVIGEREEVTWEDLSKLQFTGQCIKEALRLHAAVPGIERVLTEEVDLNGHKIKAGTRCLVHLWCLHNNPHVWDEPHLFKPERFDHDHVAKMDPFQFIPFSAGSRNCIGQNFAMNEMKVIISHILKKFHLSSDPDRPTQRQMSITLKAENGAFIQFSTRK